MVHAKVPPAERGRGRRSAQRPYLAYFFAVVWEIVRYLHLQSYGGSKAKTSPPRRTLVG